MIDKILTLGGILLLLALGTSANAGEGAHQCAPDGIGVGGFDLVSYHKPGGPQPGLAEFEAAHAGLRYRFASQDHLETFLAAPDDYLPHYRGWCAATLSMGRLACPDYSNFKIENGDLLLFELAGFTNGRTLWNSDPEGFRQRADDHAARLFE